MTDQQSATMMSCAGNAFLNTPTMDAIADCGLRFDRAYCTDPVCIPSRFSLMTGRMPSAINMRSNYLEGVTDPIPEHIIRNGLGHLLRAAGYETTYAGKEHFPRMNAADLGFDYIEKDERELMAAVTADYVRKPKDKPFCLVASFINPHDICYMAIRDFANTEHSHRLIEKGKVEIATLDEALKLPQDMSREEFLAKRCPPLPPGFEIQAEEPGAIAIMQKDLPFKAQARATYTEEQWRMHRWAYIRLTETVDHQIGKLWEAIKEMPDADNTIVIFTSDHGDMDSAHRMEHKTAFYDEACRIPLIIACPGARGRAAVDRTHLVSNGLDLLPTVCDFAGAEIPPDLDGMSMRPLYEDDADAGWRSYLNVESEIGYMVMDDRYKYMRFDEGDNAEQLINLQDDPHETRNAINDPESAMVLAELREEYERVKREA